MFAHLVVARLAPFVPFAAGLRVWSSNSGKGALTATVSRASSHVWSVFSSTPLSSCMRSW